MLIYILHWGLYLSILNYCLPIETNSKVKISSNLVSLTHALGTIGGSAYILYNINNFDGLNNEILALMTFSASYFTYDCLFMLVNNFSLIFFIHHLLILGVYYIALTYDYGAKLILFTIFWGEITNPLQITWFLSRELNYKKLEHYIFPVFSFNFIIIRTLILPIIHYTMISSLFETKNYYYPTLGLTALSILGNLGGMLWTKKMIKKIIN
jgi:hypothetical protein